MIVFCLCGQSSSECWSKQSPVWDISVIGRELNSIGKGGCGRIEGTLSKCGANHVFALDDAEHLPTQVLIQVVPSCILPRGWGFSYVSPVPKPPSWQLRSSRGETALCRFGGLWRIGNNAGQTVPGRFPSRSKRRTNGRPRRGCTPGPCGRSALRLWELGGTPRPQLNSRPPRFLGAAASLQILVYQFPADQPLICQHNCGGE